MKAEEDRDNLYFFCLDEMNLAHVEYYFSQFLSALEEDNPSDRWIPLMSERAQASLSVHTPYRILIPPNLLFTGTINVDETTQPLSDKVIDRANTIEFFAVELDKIPERRPLPNPIVVSAATWHSYITHEPDTNCRTQIIEIGKILNKADLGLGYRIQRDIELYLANSKNLLQPIAAFDLQVKQRILPRVRGTETIRPILDELTTFMKRNNLTRSEKRLDEMKVRLKRDGYTNFWR
jgi:5-methylcytosine-specific restriction endonuclease McrBC GTP-binding regulatory subunit McrB